VRNIPVVEGSTTTGNTEPQPPSPPADTSSATTEPAAPRPAMNYRPLQTPATTTDSKPLPAVQGLLAAADTATKAGNLELASAQLERAQRLAPQSAPVYLKLAELRLRQKRPAEAEQLARKGLAQARQADTQAALWRQIAASRQQRGLFGPAQEALKQAESLEKAP
jgi:tetratricopeptide (TPR) repeat protein